MNTRYEKTGTKDDPSYMAWLELPRGDTIERVALGEIIKSEVEAEGLSMPCWEFRPDLGVDWLLGVKKRALGAVKEHIDEALFGAIAGGAETDTVAVPKPKAKAAKGNGSEPAGVSIEGDGGHGA